MDPQEFEPYLEELRKTRLLFPGLTILSGVEADYVEGMEGYLEGFLSSHDFDFVLMSVHFIASWPEDEWVFDFSGSRPLSSVYGDYFREIRKGIETGLFDCVAHLDLIKQPGMPVLASNHDDVEKVLELCAERRMSVEINTSGVRKEISETYPADEIVRLMLRRGTTLVTGSDAHAPSQVGLSFEDLSARYGEALGRRLVRYRGRTMQGPGRMVASAPRP